MKKQIIYTLILLGVLGFSFKAMAGGVIKIDGSSTVYPISEAVAEEFQKTNGGAVKVTVGISGTGGGFKKFCRGELDMSNASRPIKSDERVLCKDAGIQYIELPVAYDALTVVVNPNNTWATSMTVAELKKIWEPAAQGKIMTWNQVRADWPNQPIKLYGAGSDSGTFDYFTEAIVGIAKASRGDYTASEDDNVLVQGVANDVNALGYFGYAYYIENATKLKSVAIDGGKGAILPSRETVENGSYAPLGRPIFVYIKAKSAKDPVVKGFVDFYIKNAKALVAEVKYIPFDDALYLAIGQRFNGLVLGSSFSGAPSGVHVAENLKRPPQL